MTTTAHHRVAFSFFFSLLFLIHNLWQLYSQLVIQLFYTCSCCCCLCVCVCVRYCSMFHDDKIVANYLYKCSTDSRIRIKYNKNKKKRREENFFFVWCTKTDKKGDAQAKIGISHNRVKCFFTIFYFLS